MSIVRNSNQIETTLNQKGGKRYLVVGFGESKEILRMVIWYPKFNSELTLEIDYVKNGGQKAHERRHASDMINVFEFLSEMIFEIETNYSDNKFDTKEECEKFSKKVEHSGENSCNLQTNNQFYGET